MPKAITNQWPEPITSAVPVQIWHVVLQSGDYVLSKVGPAEAIMITDSGDIRLSTNTGLDPTYRVVSRGTSEIIINKI